MIALTRAGNHILDDNAGDYYVYTVIPEFPSLLILLLFMMTTLLAVMVYKKEQDIK